MPNSHYQVLGVAPHASHDEIRRAFRALAQRHHPDANPNDEAGARTTMAQINVAWSVLSDPDKRRAYDWAIGTTPRPRYGPPGSAPHVDGDGEGDGAYDDNGDPLAHLRDDPDAEARSRPSDLLLILPVGLAIVAVITFVFAVMSESTLLRTAAILLAPITVGAFIAAPLFVMLRARRDG